jgi:hypothetical protein
MWRHLPIQSTTKAAMRFIAAFASTVLRSDLLERCQQVAFSKSTQDYRFLSFGWIMLRVQPVRKIADTTLHKLRIEIEWVKE